jgi:uncharacterized protein (DUF488 family)
MQIFTLGYQSLAPELYVKALVDAGVKLVIDVRENPWSQRSGYVGAILKRTLASVDIDYEHWRALGNPAANRNTATTAAQCLRRYRTYLRQDGRIITLFVNKLTEEWNRDRKVCLTCFEHEHSNCHRSVIVDEIRAIDREIISIHLTPERAPRKQKPRQRSQPLFAPPSFP